MTYVDQLRNWGWRLGPSCHLVASSPEELDAFAALLGMKPAWRQTSRGGVPHYDLTAKRRLLAVRLGAQELTDRDFAALCGLIRSRA